MAKKSDVVHYCLIHRLKFKSDLEKIEHATQCKMLILEVKRSDERFFDPLIEPDLLEISAK